MMMMIVYIILLTCIINFSDVVKTYFHKTSPRAWRERDMNKVMHAVKESNLLLLQSGCIVGITGRDCTMLTY